MSWSQCKAANGVRGSPADNVRGFTERTQQALPFSPAWTPLFLRGGEKRLLRVTAQIVTRTNEPSSLITAPVARPIFAAQRRFTREAALRNPFVTDGNVGIGIPGLSLRALGGVLAGRAFLLGRRSALCLGLGSHEELLADSP
jgi:hypothetical protein